MEKSAIFLDSKCDLTRLRPGAGPVKCPDLVRSIGAGAGGVVTSEGRRQVSEHQAMVTRKQINIYKQQIYNTLPGLVLKSRI